MLTCFCVDIFIFSCSTKFFFQKKTLLDKFGHVFKVRFITVEHLLQNLSFVKERRERRDKLF